MESPTRCPGGDPLRCWVQCHRGRSGNRCHDHRRLPAELREAPPGRPKEPGAPEPVSSPTLSRRLSWSPWRRQGTLSLGFPLGAEGPGSHSDCHTFLVPSPPLLFPSRDDRLCTQRTHAKFPEPQLERGRRPRGTRTETRWVRTHQPPRRAGVAQLGALKRFSRVS